MPLLPIGHLDRESKCKCCGKRKIRAHYHTDHDIYLCYNCTLDLAKEIMEDFSEILDEMVRELE